MNRSLQAKSPAFRAAVMVAGVILVVAGGTGIVAAQEPDAREGAPAPRFFLPELNGGDFYLRWYTGPDSEIVNRWRTRRKSVVVLSFFATWCTACRKELPELDSLSRAYAGQPVQWRLVNVGEGENAARSFVARLGVKIPVLMDRYRTVTRRYCTSLPTLVVIDRGGIIRYLHTGYDERDPDGIKRVAAAVSGALGIRVPAGWETTEAKGSRDDAGLPAANESPAVRASP